MKNGMKQTVIGEIPADWEVIKLGDIGEFKTSSVDKVIVDGEQIVSLVNYMDVYRRTCIKPSDTFSKTSATIKELESFSLKRGDVLFTPSSETPADIGHSAVVEEDLDALYSYHLVRYRLFGDDLDDSFKKHVFNNPIILAAFARKATGSTRYTLSKKSFEDTIACFPKSRPEQQKIAEILSTVDEKMAVIDEQLAQTQELKKGLMQRLLTRGIGHTAFKDSPLGEIPDSWEATEVQHALTIHNTLRKPLSAGVRSSMKGEYRYYGPTGILDYINEFMLDGKYALIGEDGDHFLKYKVKKMTLLVEGKFNVNNHAHILSGNESCLTEWFHLFYQHRGLDAYLTRQGAGRYKLTKAALQRLPIAVPPIAEQKIIIELISCIDDKLQVLTDKKAQYKELKRGLMQQLLTGQRRVRVAAELTIV